MSRRVFGWGSGVGVVLAVVSGGLVNELHGGWPWWMAAAVVTLAAATLAAWLATAGGGQVQVDEGGVYAGRNVDGRVRTRVRGAGSSSQRRGGGTRIGRGAVGAGQDVTGDVDTDVRP
ncbi:hypothetical protein [Plantactinospora sp. CA-290183]|uniref:hypothetical protein n=1 Tax=Plantactinospora sp. CA-290183 TaxID=3240006 RepID=UPI003D8FDEBD